MPSTSPGTLKLPRPAATAASSELVEVGPRIAVLQTRRDRRIARRRRRALLRRQGDLAEHDPAALNGVGEDGVVGLQVGQRRLEIARRQQQQAGRIDRQVAVGLGEGDVEADGGGAVLLQAVDQAGQHRARPRPLPQPRQAGLVDVDDGDGERRRLARHPLLEHVEELEAHGDQQLRVPRAHYQEIDEQQQADQAALAEDASQAVPGPGHAVGYRTGAAATLPPDLRCVAPAPPPGKVPPPSHLARDTKQRI
jgi:hypothetical protein